MGMGDIKLAIFVGLILGYQLALWGVAIDLVLSLLFGFRRRRTWQVYLAVQATIRTLFWRPALYHSCCFYTFRSKTPRKEDRTSALYGWDRSNVEHL